MKRTATLLLLMILATVLLTACGNSVDAGTVFREATSNLDNLQNCTSTLTNTLEFTSGGQQKAFRTNSNLTYFASPFNLHSLQTSDLAGSSGSTDSYILTENGECWFYSRVTDANGQAASWQKTAAGALDTTPSTQVDTLRLLSNVMEQKYIRTVTLNGVEAHKLEIAFSSEVLRPFIENIVTATGMSAGSQTIVDALLEGVPKVYGYCYIDKSKATVLRVELNAADTLNQIFQNIDGGSDVRVSQCAIIGEIANIGLAPEIVLPEEAKTAQSAEAVG